MDRIRVTETTWRGMDAWALTGPDLRLTVMRTGGHLASITAAGDDLDPLWQPPWPAASPESAASRADVYGDGPEASLLAAIVGHNLCIDRFGPPWPGERKPVHGEAGVVEWDRSAESTAHRVVLAADLPRAGLRVSRAFEFDHESIVLTTTVAHDEASPREIEWAEHVTIGDPFLDGARFTAEVDGAWIWDGEPRDAWRFAEPGPHGKVDAAAALEMPTADTPEAVGDIVTTRLTSGGFRAERPDLGRVLEYLWDADEFPWLCLWTQHKSRTGRPWNGVTRARGMEFSTKPFPEGKPPASRETSYQGRPTTCRVPPGPGLTRTVRIRWSSSERSV